MSKTSTLSLFIGRDVRLRDPHPHAGCAGVAVRVEGLKWVGPALLVALRQCRHGVSGCYVFHAQQVKAETGP